MLVEWFGDNTFLETKKTSGFPEYFSQSLPSLFTFCFWQHTQNNSPSSRRTRMPRPKMTAC